MNKIQKFVLKIITKVFHLEDIRHRQLKPATTSEKTSTGDTNPSNAKNFESLFNSIQDFVFIMSRKGQIVFANKTLVQKLLYSYDELLNHTIITLHNPEQQHETLTIIDNLVSGKVDTCLLPLRAKDGTAVNINTKITTGWWDGMEVLICISQLIQEPKHEDITIGERDERFFKAFHANPTPTSITEISTGRLIDFNEQWIKLFGYTRDVLGCTTKELNIPYDWSIREKIVEELLQKGSIKDYHYKIVTKLGEIKDVLWSLEIITLDGKEVILTLFQDITERLRTEAALREAEFKFRTIFSFASDGFLAANVIDKRLTIANSKICEMLGYTEAELLQMSVEDIHPQESLPHVFDNFDKLIKKEIKIANDIPMKRKDGSIFYTDISASLITLGEKENLLGLFRDISDRKQSEEALRKSESRLRKAQEIAHVGNWELDLRTQIFWLSKEVAQIYGFDPSISELPLSEIEKYILGTEHGTAFQSIQASIASNKEINKEFQIKRADNGNIRTIHAISEYVLSPDGKPEKLIGVIQDISERKQAEVDLEWEQYLMHSLLDTIPDFIYFKDTESRFLRISKALSMLFGLDDPVQAIGKTDDDFFEDEHSHQAFKDEQEIIRTGIPIIGKEEMETWPDKPPTWVSTTKMPLLDKTGKIIGTFGISRSITEQKLAEQVIKMLSKAVEQSPSSIIITNAQGNIEYVNTRFTTLMQYSLEEVKGKKPRIFNPGHDSEENFTAMWNNLKSGIFWQGEFQNRKKDKTMFWEHVMISPLLNEDGTISHFILNMEDITEKKKMLDNLIKAKEKAEESDHLKSAFLQNMSHEIRTPLNSIMGFSTMLNIPELSNEKRSSYTNIIINSSNQLLSIVSDILTVSSLETKQEKVNLNKVCINSIIVDLLAIFRQQADNHNISLYAKQQLSDKQSEIYTDKTKITQILTNLLINALKFTHEGYIEFGYNLYKHESGNVFFRFFVKDTGIGIKPDLQEKIFERFRQADLSINKNYGGTGLGLSISKGFVDLLGGEIWVESKPEQGSTFYFTIPYKPVNETDLTDSVTMQMKKVKTVLIAEDEEYNYLLLEELLSNLDLKIIHTINGDETVEVCKQNPDIDVILMDIKMPLMDGHSAAKLIKQFHPNLPIIAQSAYALEHEIKKFSDKAFDDYIIKPIKEDELIQKLSKYIKIQDNK